MESYLVNELIKRGFQIQIILFLFLNTFKVLLILHYSLQYKLASSKYLQDTKFLRNSFPPGL